MVAPERDQYCVIALIPGKELSDNKEKQNDPKFIPKLN
jgi:hypothetical protein